MYYVYLLYNDSGQLIYVGKSKNIHTRISKHKSSKNWGLHKISRVLIAECESETEMAIYEIYYINKLKPLFNTVHVNNDMPTCIVKELDFKEYVINNLVTDPLRKKKKPETFKRAKEEKIIDEEDMYLLLIQNKQNIIGICNDEYGDLCILFNEIGEMNIKEELTGCDKIIFNDGYRNIFSYAKYYIDEHKCLLGFDDKKYEGSQERIDKINKLYDILELNQRKLD